MALDRIYRLSCDSWSLLDFREREPARELQRLLGLCKVTSPNKPTSIKARSAAKAAGWVRHREDFSINAAHPSAGTSTHRFDLCPNCAPALVEDKS